MDKDKIIQVQPQSIQPPPSTTTNDLVAFLATRIAAEIKPAQHIHHHHYVQTPHTDDNTRTLLHALAGLAIVLLFFFGAMSITVLIWQGVHASTQYQTGGH